MEGSGAEDVGMTVALASPMDNSGTGPNDDPKSNLGICSFGDYDELWEYPEIDPEVCDWDENYDIKSTDDEEGTSGDPEPPSMSTNHEPSLRKRSRHEWEDHANGDPDEPFVKRPRHGWEDHVNGDLDEPPQGFTLACPFFRHNPVKYQMCHGRKLTSISRVIQHIMRFHTRPAHCPICFRTFNSADARDEHLIEQACQIGEHVVPDGITRSQEARLRSRRAPRNMSVNDRWFRIWNILFSEAPKTNSIYLGDWQSEVIDASRQFMNQEGVAIIVRQLERDDSRWKNDEGLKKRLENALCKFEVKGNATAESARGKRS
ncbi:hypothetical protein Neosp_013143 [[Neocosmospora] mangrovei]